jgi:hypothetical protein
MNYLTNRPSPVCAFLQGCICSIHPSQQAVTGITNKESFMKTIKAWLVVLAGALLTLGMLPANAAPTPAGTVIGNQATATYNDAGGTPRTASSNQVTTTVSQVKSFTLNANGADRGAGADGSTTRT